MKKGLVTMLAVLMMIGTAGMISGCDEPPADEMPEENDDL